MLKVSRKSVIEKDLKLENFSSYRRAVVKSQAKRQINILWGLGIFALLFVFLPWTQNTRVSGRLIALEPEKRPQTIHSIIAGRIEKWYVREGDYVEKGDTILFISEIMDAFMDPDLLGRTQQQIDAKGFSVNAYDERLGALQRQLDALKTNRKYRLEQGRNRVIQAKLQVTSDSIQFQASKVNFEIAKKQLARSEKLFDDGLTSLTELENRTNRMQQEQVKIIAAENNMISSKNDLLTAKIELNSIEMEFDNAIAKTESELYSTMSSRFETEIDLTKLENQFSNFKVRAGNLYVVAPQSGYITQAIQVGIGETIDRGARIASILPDSYQLAAEIFIDPIDLPLVDRGNKVRFIFDGWPAIVFSGWPQISNGTFGGVVEAVDRFTSPNNKYRLLVVPDPNETPWPEPLRIGTGAEAIMLFNDVPIWYEIWRQLNGFPPDFYEQDFGVQPKKKFK